MAHSYPPKVPEWQGEVGYARAVFAPARLAALFLLLSACSVPVASNLEEGEANRVVASLDRQGLAADKEADPTADNRFRVTVPRGDAPAAVRTLADEALPRERPRGTLDVVDKGALVPSAAAEHAGLVAGAAGDLERTFSGVDGVLFARVHLALPERDPFREVKGQRASASVLVEHRGTTPPLTQESIQRLVAGSVDGLAPSDVQVVLVSRPLRAATHDTELVRLGPMAVARGSLRVLQGTFGGLVFTSLVLALGLLALYARYARLKGELETEKTEKGEKTYGR